MQAERAGEDTLGSKTGLEPCVTATYKPQRELRAQVLSARANRTGTHQQQAVENVIKIPFTASNGSLPRVFNKRRVLVLVT